MSALGKTTEHDTMETFYTGFPGWGWRAGWWGGGVGTTETQVIPERVGTLTVDVFDANTKQLIFRGQSTDTLSNNADKNDKKMEHSVEEMFKKLPTHERSRASDFRARLYADFPKSRRNSSFARPKTRFCFSGRAWPARLM